VKNDVAKVGAATGRLWKCIGNVLEICRSSGAHPVATVCGGSNEWQEAENHQKNKILQVIDFQFFKKIIQNKISFFFKYRDPWTVFGLLFENVLAPHRINGRTPISFNPLCPL
jgi:hypothetical protein